MLDANRAEAVAGADGIKLANADERLLPPDSESDEPEPVVSAITTVSEGGLATAPSTVAVSWLELVMPRPVAPVA